MDAADEEQSRNDADTAEEEAALRRIVQESIRMDEDMTRNEGHVLEEKIHRER